MALNMRIAATIKAAWETPVDKSRKKYEASSMTATTALILRSRSLWFTMIRSMTSRLKTCIYLDTAA